LPERMVQFLATVPDLCELYGSRNRFAFPMLLDVHWRGAGTLWRHLTEDDELKLPR